MKAVKRDAREMKDSGIEWIGEMPQLWSTARLKDICSIQTGTTPDKKRQDEYYTNEGGIPWIKAENLGDSTPISITKEYLTDKGANAGRVFANNTVYVCCIASIGKVGYSEITCSCNQQINGLIFDSKYIDYKYGFYMSLAQEEEYMLRASGNVLKILNTQQQSYIPCVVPSLREQQAIADYLDDRCAKIDAIIAEAKASIEEYKELKQATISYAILHGLHTNCKKIYTEEKWVEKIPSGWRIEKGKHLFFETNQRSVTGEEELLTVSQYTGITPRSQKNVTMIEALSLVDYKICDIGDIAANTMWMWAGAVGVSTYHGVISPSYNTYRQLHNDFDSKYLDYLLRTPELVQEYASLSTGLRASRLRLYPTQFLSIYYPVPPKNEQLEIIEYLKTRIPNIDELISEKQSLIEDLESYKKSLIYEVVTGKRKVVD